jgi:hypothetical protein
MIKKPNPFDTAIQGRKASYVIMDAVEYGGTDAESLTDYQDYVRRFSNALSDVRMLRDSFLNDEDPIDKFFAEFIVEQAKALQVPVDSFFNILVGAESLTSSEAGLLKGFLPPPEEEEDTMPNLDESSLGAILGKLINTAGGEALRTQTVAKFDPDITYEGTKIILPKEPGMMTLEELQKIVARKIKEQNTFMDIVEQIDAYPYDAMVSMHAAMKEMFGWATAVPTPGFWGPKAPDLMTVKTGPNVEDTLQVPMGSFAIPGIEEAITVHITGVRNNHGKAKAGLCIHAKVKPHEHDILKRLLAMTRSNLETKSIYKGKAIRLTIDENGKIVEGIEPEFLKTAHVKVDELIFPDETARTINVNLWTPIKHTQACIDARIPLKRGILLEGKFGVGKSMTATVTSKICVDNGWTFILLDKVQGLAEALEFANRYAPAVVFSEDIDRATEERDEQANDLLNILDGVLNKNAKVITVLTTNNVEKIHQAMLRPGRLDAVISILPPDPEAVKRLLHQYSRGTIAKDEPLHEVASLLAGEIPATIQEVVERSKMAMIARGGQQLVEDDLIISAKSMKRHLDLLNKDKTPVMSTNEQLGAAFAKVLDGVIDNHNGLNKMDDNVVSMKQKLDRIA